MKLPLSKSLVKRHDQGKDMTEEEEDEKEDMISAEEKVHLKKILVPIDGSAYSMNAARFAVELSKLQDAELFCIHIISKLPSDYEYIVPNLSGPGMQTHIEGIKDHVQSWFDRIIKIADEEGIGNIKTDVFMDIKSIADAIINYATNNSIDLIVIGTKGRTGLKRFMLGSVAHDVKQHAHCPVLLVR